MLVCWRSIFNWIYLFCTFIWFFIILGYISWNILLQIVHSSIWSVLTFGDLFYETYFCILSNYVLNFIMLYIFLYFGFILHYTVQSTVMHKTTWSTVVYKSIQQNRTLCENQFALNLFECKHISLTSLYCQKKSFNLN
jgi:hypothetical protein